MGKLPMKCLKSKNGVSILTRLQRGVVRLAGVEPTTPWFVAKYSIQLSYSRNSRNYAMEE